MASIDTIPGSAGNRPDGDVGAKDFDLATGGTLSNLGRHQALLATARLRADAVLVRFTSVSGGRAER